MNPLIDITRDGHVHTALCGHAVGEMEDYVRAAAAKGLRSLCFMEHLEADIRYFKRSWLTDADFDAYFAEGRRLQEVYGDRIEIVLGAEMGINPEAKDELRRQLARHPFKRVGLSCHYHPYEGRHCNLLSRGGDNLAELARLDADAVLTRYFTNLIHAARTFDCAVLCHLDAGMRHVPGIEEHMVRHRPLIMTLLETLRERGMALEINTSGFVNRGHPYPADWIIREALRLGIPLQAGSDAHSPEDVGRFFERLPGYLAGLVQEQHG